MRRVAPEIPLVGASDVLDALRERQEIALLDVRPEGLHAQGHPLFGVPLRLGYLELDIPDMIPRAETKIVVYDGGEGYAERAVPRLRALGYSSVFLLAGGIRGWVDAGGELFRDVNVPSKAFGELVAEVLRTPMIDAADLDGALTRGEDLVVVDVRPFDEYSTMRIPTAKNIPGVELLRRIDDVASRPDTTVVVNCAGRTRGIIGAQSLLVTGIRQRVTALENGTIGWKLAGLHLNQGPPPAEASADTRASPRTRRLAKGFACRAGVTELRRCQLDELLTEPKRSVYCFDVRSQAEYEQSHVSGFRHAPGGQLVQETDSFVGVRGGALVLADDDGIRAPMTGAWLAQMGWDVFTVDVRADDFPYEAGPWRHTAPLSSAVLWISVAGLAARWRKGSVLVVDLAPSSDYFEGHIPGARFVWPEELDLFLSEYTSAEVVVTSGDSRLGAVAVSQVTASAGYRVPRVLAGGTAAWALAEYPLEPGEGYLWSPPTDGYRRPYVGVDATSEDMQAYLDWESGLVQQLRRDGTHHFRIVEPPHQASGFAGQA